LASVSPPKHHPDQRGIVFEAQDKGNKPRANDIKSLEYKSIFRKKYILDPIYLTPHLSLRLNEKYMMVTE
jgi:hypothetical protein